MKTLFAPAVALMNRCGYPMKFGLLAVVVVLAFASLMLNLATQLNHTITRSQAELAGSAMLRPMTEALQAVQGHRGMAVALRAGDAGLEARQQAYAGEVESGLARLEAALSDTLRGHEGWADIRTRWAQIKSEGAGWSHGQSYDAHTELVARLRGFQAVIADEHGLSFDPEPDSHYLMTTALDRMPNLLERLGRLGAKGAGTLALARLDEREKFEINALHADVKLAMAELEANVARVAEFRPDLEAPLQATLEALREKLAGVNKVIMEIVFLGAFRNTSPEQFYDFTAQASDIGYAQSREVLLPTLDALLEQRIAMAERALNLNIGILLVVLLAIVYLSVGVYLSVMASIRALSEGSRRLASGDLTTRIELVARDELREVASSFDEMSVAMKSLLGDIKGNAGEVDAAAHRLVQASSQVDGASQRQSEAATAMAAAVEEMTDRKSVV